MKVIMLHLIRTTRPDPSWKQERFACGMETRGRRGTADAQKVTCMRCIQTNQWINS